MTGTKSHIGIALSGGGARGIAHLGVLEAFQKHGIETDAIAGTSMGAIVGCFHAAGFEPRFILEEIKKEKLTKFLKWRLPGDGLLDLESVEVLLKQHIPQDDFSALKKSFFVSVANLNAGQYEIISNGPLFKVVLASASIPVLFKPQIINESIYVDGGLLHNLPARSLVGLVNYIVGVNASASGPMENITGIKHIAERCLHLGIENNMKDDLKVCNIVVSPPKLMSFNAFEFKKADEIFKIGFDEAEKMIRLNEKIFF